MWRESGRNICNGSGRLALGEVAQVLQHRAPARGDDGGRWCVQGNVIMRGLAKGVLISLVICAGPRNVKNRGQ